MSGSIKGMFVFVGACLAFWLAAWAMREYTDYGQYSFWGGLLSAGVFIYHTMKKGK